MDVNQALQPWHDFYLVVAAASGTLLGAMFVVVSIGTGFLTAERASAVRIWTTPTVVNVSGIFVICAVLLTPILSWWLLAAWLALAGLGGLIYAGVIGGLVLTRRTELSDRVWHGLVPPAGCVMLTGAAVLVALRRGSGLTLLCVALLVLLVAAIRNAWDLLVFFASRER